MPETEREYENALRPLSFESFSGQPEAVENLKVFVAAARMRQEALDHVLSPRVRQNDAIEYYLERVGCRF